LIGNSNSEYHGWSNTYRDTSYTEMVISCNFNEVALKIALFTNV